MNKIDAIVLNEATTNPAGMQLFLAKLTQRGANIQSGEDLINMYNYCIETPRCSNKIREMAKLPHGTINRFSPITIAIVGASRRFLAQARTNQVGFDYVSASLQYSDYSGIGQFAVPYALMENEVAKGMYLRGCESAMEDYMYIAADTDNDTAGYIAPQGLRNILIMQGNHQSWDYFIRLRSCNRNTTETQYVTLRIWEELLKTRDGVDLFALSGADCVNGKCREGKMTCGHLLQDTSVDDYMREHRCSLPRAIIETKFPLLNKEANNL